MGRIRVLNLIARLNVGGPADHVTLLAGAIDPDRFDLRLATGVVGRDEASMEDLARDRGVDVVRVPGLGPEIRPDRDTRAFAAVGRILREFRPHVVHTHTAKAGFVGRAAALALQRPRPALVHTYHGHVLEGYFGGPVTAVYRGLERALGTRSDRLIGVSDATVDDLVRLGVAPRERFTTIRLGMRLEPFLELAEDVDPAWRWRSGVPDGVPLFAYVGRLVPIKRVGDLIDATAQVPGAHLAVAGDGEERAALEARALASGAADRIHFTGWERDVPAVLAASDAAVLASANEGTPVSLIEAAAAARPVIGTRVGGVAEVVPPQAGRLVAAGDVAGIAAAMRELVEQPQLRAQRGRAGRAHVRAAFAAQRMVQEIERLYTSLATGA